MLAACWSEGAIAQTSPLRDLDIFVGNVLTYDDNVFRTADGVTRPNTRGSDWIIEPTVSVKYSRPLARGNVSVHGALSYKFYRRNDDLNNENIDFGADASTAIWRCQVGGSVAFSRAQSDLADVIDGGPLVNVENRLDFGGSVLCGDDIGIKAGVEYSHQTVTNGSSLREISDNKNDTYTARIGYSRPTLGFLSIYGTIQDGSYPNRPALGPGLPAQDEIRTYSGGLSYSRSIGNRLSGSASVGYMRVKPASDLSPEFKGLTYSGNLTYRGSDRISASLAYSRASRQSNLLGVDYSITTQFTGVVNYALSSSIGLTGNASYAKRRFQSSVFGVSPVDLTGSGDTTKQFGGSVNFKSFRRITIALGASHFERDSRVAGLDYSGNRVSLTTGLTF